MILRLHFPLAIALTLFIAGCPSQSSQGNAPATSSSSSPAAPSPNAAMPGAAATSTTVHATPVCAVQDCVTHKIVDNGCTPSGECASCINYCPPQNSITVTPSSTPPMKHQ